MQRKRMLFFKVVFFGLFILGIYSNLPGAMPASERAALIALYNSTNGDNWKDNSGWKTPPLNADGFAMPGTEGNWHGVWVSESGDNIIRVVMDLNNNEGSIPHEIENVTELEIFQISQTNLSGTIPIEFFNLKKLKIINFSGDKLTGNIPPEIGNLTNLEVWLTNFNNLTGTIPKKFGNLTKMRVLNIFCNSFTGSIPPELGNLTQLEELSIGCNQITGTIPPQLGNITNLKLLHLKFSELSGPIPPELGNLQNLIDLELEVNNFTGSIPPELGDLKNLVILRAANNQLSGSIPPQLGNLSNLTDFQLSGNQLSGLIPSELGNLTKLTHLSIDHNQLTGEIPNNLTNLTKLAKPNVDIGYNCLYAADPTLIQWLNNVDPDWEMNQDNCQGIEQKITVKSPNGGEKWMVGSTHDILWTYVGQVGDLRIQYSTDGGNSWNTITQTTPKTGSYSWTIPNTLSDKCKIKIEAASDGNPTDMSDLFFSIVEYIDENIKVSGRLRVVDPQNKGEWPINHITLPSKVELYGNVKNITLDVKEDGTFEAAEMLSEGSYSGICRLRYKDYIPYDNSEYMGGDQPPFGSILERLSIREFTVYIDKDHSYIDIDFPLPIFMVHGIRSGWKWWDSWASYLLSEGYIVFTPNHDFIFTSKATESDQIAEQFYADLDCTSNSYGAGLFNKNYPDVFFICHSEGGVVVRVLVNQHLTIRNKVKSLFTLGTPHSGTDFPGAEIFSISKTNIIFGFNKIYKNFNGVPVYAISGHGLVFPNINYEYMPHDGVVFWNYPPLNISPFAICIGLNPIGPSFIQSESFAGYADYYTPNGHHFPLSHSNLVKDGIVDILINTIIPNMAISNAAIYGETYAKNFNSINSNSEAFLRKILDQTFSISKGTNKTFEIRIPSTDFFTINALGIKSAISVNLTDPDGKSITGTNYSTFPNVDYSSDILGGIAYQISAPKPGNWTITVKAGNKDDVVALGGSINSNWDVYGYTNKSSYQPKEQAVLKAKISGSTNGITISKIQAFIFNNNWTEISKIELYDDGKHNDDTKGDGLYANTVNVPNTEGVYFVKYYSDVLEGGQTTQRESIWNFSVAKSASILKGNFSDDSMDNDSDGVKDQIIETIALNFSTPGQYILSGQLEDSTGTLIDEAATVVKVVNLGDYQGRLAFDVKELSCSQFSSPFLVKNITISRADDLAPLDKWDKTVSTKTYEGSDFGCSSGEPIIALNRNKLNFGVVAMKSSTPQNFTIENSGNGVLNWEISTNANWLIFDKIEGRNAGVVTVNIDSANLSAETYTGNIFVSDPLAKNSPQTIAVNLTVYNQGSTTSPFGEFSTPIDGSLVMGSIAVTGWVLDDVGVESFKIYRGEANNIVYIGDAVFVAGARPDVEQAYPEYPMNYRAGWGYMMLTNFLPNGGNGEFKIHTVATDADGHQISLGTKRITCDNAHAVKPFGAIDTPGQGGTASGSSYHNWGWVLTPPPNMIPTNGNTINVWVDGINLGHPIYNIYRSDVAALFPGYANSNGAAGYFDIDTTAYNNGLHTIQWTAADSAGNTDGIGSRYFIIQNTRSSQVSSINLKRTFTPGYKDLIDIPISYDEPVKLKKGYTDSYWPESLSPDTDGNIHIKCKELERIDIQVSQAGIEVEGYMMVGNRLMNLPVGSTLEKITGRFSWIPGPGFVGTYRLVFVETNQYGEKSRKNIVVTIVPKFSRK